MCSFASNVIGSHPAPLRATLLHFFSKNIFRTLFFRTRSQKGTFKAFPTKWYTLSLFQSSVCVIDAVSPAFPAAKATAPVHTRHNCQLTLRHPFLWKRSLSYILVITVRMYDVQGLEPRSFEAELKNLSALQAESASSAHCAMGYLHPLGCPRQRPHRGCARDCRGQ